MAFRDEFPDLAPIEAHIKHYQVERAARLGYALAEGLDLTRRAITSTFRFVMCLPSRERTQGM